MALTLGREAFLEYRCFGMPDKSPKRTEDAARKLRQRGCAATVPVLNYLIKQGKVVPERDGRNFA